MSYRTFQKDDNLKSWKVLFMHGLESGPQGTKSHAINEHFTCYTPNMADILKPLLDWKRNAAVKKCIFVAGCWFVVNISIFASWWFQITPLPDYIIGFPVVSSLLAFYIGQGIIRSTVCEAVEKCVAIQEKAIQEFNPDIVVGSSFGGGIAVYCLMRGSWKGPTLLFAPAQYLIAEKSGFVLTKDIALPAKHPIKIIHARTDPTVPLSHSEDLVARSNTTNISLTVVEDNHALTKHSTPDKMKEFISELITKLMLNTFCD